MLELNDYKIANFYIYNLFCIWIFHQNIHQTLGWCYYIITISFLTQVPLSKLKENSRTMKSNMLPHIYFSLPVTAPVTSIFLLSASSN